MKLPTKIIENVVNEISKLPGIGKKTALRLSLFLLKKDLEFSKNISKAIIDLKEKTTFCKVCHMICEDDNCSCQDDNSLINKKILCVVEDTPDALAIQNTNHYNGLFHVIGGLISPIDGIGPENLNIESLVKRVDEGEINEIIFADSEMINTVIRNLVSNSIKFSMYNSVITVSSKSDDGNWYISVTDEGIGMEENYIKDLFKIDVHTSRYGTNKEKGTGLGLVLCNEFIMLHKGSIKIVSELNKGTEFTIQLPKENL